MAQCRAPFYRKDDPTGDYWALPCGKCPDCLARRVSGWSFRLMQEDRRSVSSLFVTLTYDTNTVPISDCGRMTLCKRDLQLFFKRLRKLAPETKIKYYAVGEYGTHNWRPHYHIILFNADYTHVQKAWCIDGRAIGHIHYGSVSGASVGYTLKYVMKPKRVPQYRGDDRIPEFSLMSKGLGTGYMTDAMISWHKADLENRMYCNTMDGKKISMPRYYKDKIYTVSEVDSDGRTVYVGERERIAFFARIRAQVLNDKFEQEMLDKYGDDWTRVKVESDFWAFDKMYREAVKGRNL